MAGLWGCASHGGVIPSRDPWIFQASNSNAVVNLPLIRSQSKHLSSAIFCFDQGHPQVELRMSNNTVHVRTCSDSCSALLQLIQYIAADGDLVPSYEPETPDSAKTPSVCLQIQLLVAHHDLPVIICLHVDLCSQTVKETWRPSVTLWLAIFQEVGICPSCHAQA